MKSAKTIHPYDAAAKYQQSGVATLTAFMKMHGYKHNIRAFTNADDMERYLLYNAYAFPYSTNNVIEFYK